MAKKITTRKPTKKNPGGGRRNISSMADIIAKGLPVDVRAYDSFSVAIDAISTDAKTLLIPNQQSVTDDKTVPANITLQFLQGGSLNISAAKTVTVNGCVEAGLYQIFSGSGSVSGLKKVYPVWFGAKIDGSTDDSAACQKALDALIAGGECLFPRSNYNCLIKTRLIINKGEISIVGDSGTTIACVGCSGILVNKVRGFQIKNITISLAPRYKTTPNNYIGIDIDGDAKNFAYSNIIRDVYIDGFRTAIEANWIWSSVFDHVVVTYGYIGLEVKGLSVNNVITNSSIWVGDGEPGSCCVFFGDNTKEMEGWMISNNLFFGAEIGMMGLGCSHVYLVNNIFDFCHYVGIYMKENDAHLVSVNWSIQNNYFAMTGKNTLGAAVLALQNTPHPQTEGHKIIGNTIRVYGKCSYGIRITGTECKNNMIIGNSLKNFEIYDIILDGGEATNIVTGNQCLSNLATHIYAPNGGLIQNNAGIVHSTQFTTYGMVGKMKIVYGETAPTSGTWNQGDICWRTTPAASQTPGWICVTAGTPGTWKAMANLAD